MLQRIVQTYRQLSMRTAPARLSRALDVTALEERATPATAFLAAPVDPPVMSVIADLPAAPSVVSPARPIVRLDLLPIVGSAPAPAQDWTDFFAGEPAAKGNAGLARQAPQQETDAPAPPADGNGEDLALLEAEWAAMQQTSLDV